MSIERSDALWASCSVHTDAELGPSFVVNAEFAPFGAVSVTPVTSFQNGVGDYSMVLARQVDPRSRTVFATLRSATDGTIVVAVVPGATEDFELRVRTFVAGDAADIDFDLLVVRPGTQFVNS